MLIEHSRPLVRAAEPAPDRAMIAFQYATAFLALGAAALLALLR